jgi:AcrR family transcriptional regulator
METEQSSKRPGRPREFSEQEALDAATRVFADKGYSGASLSDLTEAMGINRVSLYATFGNKEALFRKAMERYTQSSEDRLAGCLTAGTAREAIEKLLRSGVKMLTAPDAPGSCFVTQAPLTEPEATEETCRYMARKREDVERALQRRFERAIEDGELKRTVSAEALASTTPC